MAAAAITGASVGMAARASEPGSQVGSRDWERPEGAPGTAEHRARPDPPVQAGWRLVGGSTLVEARSWMEAPSSILMLRSAAQGEPAARAIKAAPVEKAARAITRSPMATSAEARRVDLARLD
jgi:hypothetical protein